MRGAAGRCAAASPRRAAARLAQTRFTANTRPRGSAHTTAQIPRRRPLPASPPATHHSHPTLSPSYWKGKSSEAELQASLRAVDAEAWAVQAAAGITRIALDGTAYDQVCAPALRARRPSPPPRCAPVPRAPRAPALAYTSASRTKHAHTLALALLQVLDMVFALGLAPPRFKVSVRAPVSQCAAALTAHTRAVLCIAGRAPHHARTRTQRASF